MQFSTRRVRHRNKPNYRGWTSASRGMTCLLFALCWWMAAPSQGQLDIRTLTQFQELAGEVRSPKVTPDGTQILFLASVDEPHVYELFSLPVGGGTMTRLSQPMAPSGSVLSFEMTADGSRVVYLANAERYRNIELYTTPVAGGDIRRLNHNFGPRGIVVDFKVSPDGQWVAYRGQSNEFEKLDLYKVNMLAGAPSRLSEIDNANTQVYLFSPDSQWLVFREGFNTISEGLNLYQVGASETTAVELLDSSNMYDVVLDPSSTYIYLAFNSSVVRFPLAGGPSETLVTGSDRISEMKMSPDGRHLAFSRMEPSDPPHELWTYDLQTETLRLVYDVAIELWDFDITSDSQNVIFTGAYNEGPFAQLRRGSLLDGSVERLSPLFGLVPRLGDFRLSADGSRVLYAADLEAEGKMALFGVDVAGGAIRRFSDPPPAPDGLGVTDFGFDDTGNSALFLIEQGDAEGVEAFSHAWIGGTQTRLNQDMPAGGDVTDLITHGGDVFFTAEGDRRDVVELYRVPVAGGAVSQLNTSPTGIGGSAGLRALSADESIFAYAVEEAGVRRLYGQDLDGTSSEAAGTSEGEGGPRLLDELTSVYDEFSVSGFDITNQWLAYVVRSEGPSEEQDSVWSVATARGQGPIALNDQSLERVWGLDITEDGQYAAYAADFDDATHLLTTPLAGGTTQQIDQSSSIFPSFVLTNDSQRVIYEDEDDQLWSAPVRDGVPTHLNVVGTAVRSWRVSPDTSEVVYWDQINDDILVVPSEGGTPVEVVSNNSGSPRYSSDGQFITFTYSPGVLLNLFSVPASGGARVQLNDRSLHGGLVASYTFSPDGQWVVMVMESANQPYMLASAPVAGGPMVVLDQYNGGTVNRGVRSLRISGDSAHVVYIFNRDDGEGDVFHSIPIGGGERKRLEPDGTVIDVRPSAQGDNVYYLVLLPGFDEQEELRVVPADGSMAPLTLHPSLAPGRSARGNFVSSADGNGVIFSSDHEVLGVRQLYRTEIGDVLFIDGFESGDTQFWSQSVP